MAPAEDIVVALEAASASGPRRGQRELVGWGAVLCFGSRRRERRTVPVDGDMVVPGVADRDVVMRSGADGNKETQKGPRLKGCCFLTPPAARPPGRRKFASRSQHQHCTMDSGSGRSTHDKQQQLEHTEQQQQERQPRSPLSEPVPWQTTQATAGGSRSRRAEAERPRGAGGAPTETRSTRPSGGNEEPSNAFSPVVGLSVVAMAGLLGGRVWAVACVCAWLAALSGLRHGRERRR